LLKEIESGNLEALPEPIYIRGLLKQFADGLGLNGTEFASEFPTDIEKKQVKSGFILRLPNFQIRPLHLYILYIFLVIFSVKWISYILQESTLETSPIPTQPTALQPSPINSPKSTPMIKKPLAKPVVVEVELKAECRLKIVADGKNIFEGTLPQGTRRTWSANKQLTIETGNAGAVLVAFNKEKAKPLGKPGQVQKVTYTISP
jgi:cytoskeletal protein RodZ